LPHGVRERQANAFRGELAQDRVGETCQPGPARTPHRIDRRVHRRVSWNPLEYQHLVRTEQELDQSF
jgi:hypothetical protein